MKQCISRLINMISHLWQTLKQYVCKRSRRKIRIEDVDNDGLEEIIIDPTESDLSWKSTDQENNFKEGQDDQ